MGSGRFAITVFILAIAVAVLYVCFGNEYFVLVCMDQLDNYEFTPIL